MNPVFAVHEHPAYPSNSRLMTGVGRDELARLSGPGHLLARGQRFEWSALSEPPVFLIKEGSVKLVTRSLGSPRETILAILGPGEFFGQLPGSIAHPARQAVALEESVLCEFSTGDMEAIMQKYPGTALQITRMLGRRLERMETRLVQLLFKDSRQRIAYVLLDLLEDWGKPHHAGTLLNLRITHQDIANLAGLTRETVSMALAEFELEEFLQTFGRRIVIRNAERITAIRDGNLKLAF